VTIDIFPKAHANYSAKINKDVNISEVDDINNYRLVKINECNTMDVRIVDINTYDKLNVNIKSIDTYDELDINLKSIETTDELDVNVDEIGGHYLTNGQSINVKVVD
jgi:ribosomal protein S4E